MATRKQDAPGANPTDDAVEVSSETLEETLEPKKKSRFWLILVPVVLLAAGGGAWVAYSQYGLLAGATTALAGADSTDADAPIEYGHFSEIQGLIVNPAGSAGRRYLMVNVALESESEKVLEELAEKEVVVRDTILKVLGLRTVDDLAAIEQRPALKEELRGAVNAVLHRGKVTRLYFTQYVLQ